MDKKYCLTCDSHKDVSSFMSNKNRVGVCIECANRMNGGIQYEFKSKNKNYVDVTNTDRFTLGQIITTVCNVLNVSRKAFKQLTNSRQKNIQLAQKIYCTIAIEITSQSKMKIAKSMNKTHPIVDYNIRCTLDKNTETNKKYLETKDIILEKLYNNEKSKIEV